MCQVKRIPMAMEKEKKCDWFIIDYYNCRYRFPYKICIILSKNSTVVLSHNSVGVKEKHYQHLNK